MINSEKAKSQYVTADVKTFAIGFEYGLDDLGNPEIAVTLAGTPLQFGTDYTLSLDGQSIVLVNDVEEGQTLIIERDIDFVQDSDYQLGRIDPEQIEDDFDLSVMRDQQIRQELVDYKNVTDAALEDISEQLVEHQDSIDTLTQNVSDLETNKADKSSVYTKGETDDKLALKADKADTYTKSGVDTKLAAKADKETVYTKTETDSKLATKADASTVYTKTDVDDKLATKADKATTLAGYGITDAYTKEETDAKVSSVYRFKGSVATYGALPTSGQAVGDVWNVEDTGANYAWTGDAWDKLSETIDLTPYLTKDDASDTYATKQEVTTGLDSKQDSLPDQTGNAGRFLKTDGTQVSWGEVQTAAITTDTTLAGTGTTDSPLGIAQSVKDSIDGKVSKSGDTMTGPLSFVDGTAGTQGYSIEVDGDGQDATMTICFDYNRSFGYRFDEIAFYATSGANCTLGGPSYPWGTVYTQKINAGSIFTDIIIPTTGGTMALLSDIPDTSDLATKAEVQQEIQDAIGTIETALAEV